jgi:hypothetical protein
METNGILKKKLRTIQFFFVEVRKIVWSRKGAIYFEIEKVSFSLK